MAKRGLSSWRSNKPGSGVRIQVKRVDDYSNGTKLDVESDNSGGSTPNKVTFTFVDAAIGVPSALFLQEQDATRCTVSLQVTVTGHDTDSTPNRIEQVPGYSIDDADAECSLGGRREEPSPGT